MNSRERNTRHVEREGHEETLNGNAGTQAHGQ